MNVRPFVYLFPLGILCIVFLVILTDTHTRISERIIFKDTLGNSLKGPMKQYDPYLINHIRSSLIPPSKLPYNFTDKTKKDFSFGGQPKIVQNYLNNKTKGFFFGVGANDGEWNDNTVYLEMEYQWDGILMEAAPSIFPILLAKNRKVKHLQACISPYPFPVLVHFHEDRICGKIGNEGTKSDVPVQCYSFYSVMLALNRTVVDYFNLDVEGSEYLVLETLPWGKIEIKTFSIEYQFFTGGEVALASYMKKKGYTMVQKVPTGPDLVFIRDDIVAAKIKSG